MKGHAEDFAGGLLGLCRRFRKLHPSSLAATTGVNLGFHHHHRRPQLASARFGFGRGRCQNTRRYRDTELSQQGLGLVFMNVHRRFPSK